MVDSLLQTQVYNKSIAQLCQTPQRQRLPQELQGCCFFKGIVPDIDCDPVSDASAYLFTVVCRTHMIAWFRMYAHKHLVNITDGRHQTLYVQLMHDTVSVHGSVLPFPFNWDATKQEFCLKSGSSALIRTFVDSRSYNFTDAESVQITRIMTLLLTFGYNNPTLPSIDLQNYSSILHQYKTYILAAPYSALNEVTNNGMGTRHITLRVATPTGTIEIPYSKLPLGYQILTKYMEVHVITNSDKQTSDQFLKSLQFNIELNLSTHSFNLVHPICYLSPDSTGELTYATPLVLRGIEPRLVQEFFVAPSNHSYYKRKRPHYYCDDSDDETTTTTTVINSNQGGTTVVTP